MKCPRCGGSGKYTNIFGDYITCDFCYGTGEIAYGEDGHLVSVGKQKPMTNEEYIRSCSTEELAEVLLEIYKDGINDYKTDWWEDSKEDWMDWLKEEHHE